jgi:hypothetical protein
MRHRYLGSLGALAVVSLASIVVAGQAPPAATKTTTAATKWTPLRTAWGDPDLQGVWNNSTTTPLERPSKLAGKQVLTDQEAAELDELADQNADAPPRPGDTGTYNAWWFDRGKSLRQTSLIVDPEDGRMPPMTPRRRNELRPVRKIGGHAAPTQPIRGRTETSRSAA